MKKQYIINGPDGFPTMPEPFDTIEQAFDGIAEFCKRYIHQGYYSTVHRDRISLIDLPNHLSIEEVDAEDDTP